MSNASQRKTNRVSYTYEEYKEIKFRAEKVGLNLSDYIRSRAIGYEPREKPPRDFYDAIKQIRAVGNNINQIARIANDTGKLDELTCKKQFDVLNDLIIELKKEYLLQKKE